MLTTLPGTAMAPAPFLQTAAFAKTQLRLLLRRRALWVATLISLLGTLSAYTSVSWVQADTGQVPNNSTYALGLYLVPEFGLTCVLSAFFVAGAALEDRRRRVDALLFSRAVSSLRYTLSKISVLAGVVLGMLALDVALAVAAQPWLAKTPYNYIPQEFVFWPYIEMYLVMAVPAVLFLVPCIWLLAITTKRLLTAVAPIFIWWAIVFGTPFGLAADLFAGSRTPLGAWFDPTGLAYAREVWMLPFAKTPTKLSDLLHYSLVPLSSSFVASRLLFVALGVVALFGSAWLIERQRRPPR